jgi:hypothetical protein
MESQSKLTTVELEVMKKYVHEEEFHAEQSKLTTVELEVMKKYVHEILEEVDKIKKTK